MSQVSYGTITIVDTTDIERIYMVYAKSVSNTIPPSDELTWSESIASAPGEGDFIWQKTVVEKAITEEKTYSDPVCVTGSSGQGVEKIINYYCNYGQGQPEEDYSGWQLEIPEYDSNKPNYWTKVVVIYSDDTREDFQASGTIATFESEKVGILDSLEVALSPIQDLHGYDRPWVGGGGKNKLDDSTASGLNNVTYQNGVATEISADAKSNALFTLQAYNNGTYVRNLGTSYGNTQQLPFTKDSTFNQLNFGHSGSTKDAKLRFDVSNLPDGEYKWCFTPINYTTHPFSWKDMMIVESSVTDYSYAPYSNICPISGWDSVDVSVAGKNLLKPENLTIKNVPYTDMVFSKAVLLKAGVYTVSIENVVNATSWRFGFRFFESDGTVIIRAINGGVVSFTSSNSIVDTYNGGTACLETNSRTTTYVTLTLSRDVYVCFSFSSGDVSGTTTVDFQLELGATDTSYEPYQGTTITTTLPQTVYGGTLDVVSGVLTVDRAMVDLGTLNWSAGTDSVGQYFKANIPDIKPAPSATVALDAICSAYPVVPSNNVVDGSIAVSSGGGKTVYARDFRFADIASFTTGVTGVQFCYPLATPTTIQLTPTQIDSLLGRNNVWSDGTVEVEGHTISKKDIMIYKDNGLTDVANKSAEANTSAAEALEKANDGIISTTQLWYQTNGTSALSVPTNHSQVDQGTVTYNNWRSVRPNNSVDSYKYYYYCYEYLHGDGTYTYSAEAILDTSNLSQYQIDQLQVRIKKMWSNSTGSYMASGVKVGTETREVDINDSSTYGFNSKSTTTGVSFNYNAIPLTSLGTDGIKLYSPTLTNGVITGSRLDATLNTNGLILNKGGIKAGEGTSNFIYLSTDPYGNYSINGSSGISDWKQIIGTKFGVRADGTLYASNANISGKVTVVGSGSNVYTTQDVDGFIDGAKKIATNYITEISDGIFVHAEGTPEDPTNVNAKGVRITDETVDIIKEGKVISQYGQVTQIGESESSSITIRSNGLSLLDRNGNTAFYIEAGGNATIVPREVFMSNFFYSFPKNSSVILDDLSDAVSGTDIVLHTWTHDSIDLIFEKGQSSSVNIQDLELNMAYDGNKTFILTNTGSVDYTLHMSGYTMYVSAISAPQNKMYGDVLLNVEQSDTLYSAIIALNWDQDVIV